MRKDYLSPDNEPALHYEGKPAQEPDSYSQDVPQPSPSDSYGEDAADLMQAAVFEPHLADEQQRRQAWQQWLAVRQRQTNPVENWCITVVVGILSGPFAVIGALFGGDEPSVLAPTVIAGAVLIAPVVEETLKQSGMLLLLARAPYRIFTTWQFVVAGALSGLSFAAIENFLYLVGASSELGHEAFLRYAAFRLTVCTTVHAVCAVIASLGVARLWRYQLKTGCRDELWPALPIMAVAMILHGAYNLWALFWGPRFV